MAETPVYLHGLPGGAEELALAGVTMAVAPRAGGLEATAAQIRSMVPGPLHLVGFSLGGAMALRLAPLLNPARIDLIAPGAPLHLGDFLPRMAGAPVFRAARYPVLLRTLTAAQALGFRTLPDRALDMLFAGAAEGDRALLADPARRALLLAAIRGSLAARRAAYLAEVTDYVRRWKVRLPERVPLTIWQGEADTWVPPEMARALCASLPHARLNLLPGLGHYGALIAALPRIVAGGPKAGA